MSEPPNPNPDPNPSSSASQKPICIVCYEDLNPLTEHLQCVPACGHVLHELCLQQWVEYCGKKPTCPVCKQACGAGKKPTRLYFQSTGAASEGGAQIVTSAAELADEVASLERKVKTLMKAAEVQKNISKKLSEEVEVSKKLLESEKASAEKMKREKQCIQQLLNIKIEEISRKTMECAKLQEKSLALAKELAALKLATDMNLGEEEIIKFASLGNSTNPQNALEILKKSLAMRNKSYKELMAQCNILGRSESKTQQKLEKAKELIKKLKVRLLELEKENEERENEVLRDLKTTNKKIKLDTNFENSTKNDKTETIDLENDTSFMNMDEFLGPKRKISNKEEIENVHEKNGEDLGNGSIWVKGISLIDTKDNELDPIFSSDQIGAQNHNMNYCTDQIGAQIQNMNYCTDQIGGMNKNIGKWCKTEPKINKINGDLISVGADGRGGKIKILRSLNQFQDEKRRGLKKVGVGAKGGQSQIEQFFGKR
ncbi:hypothetical protein LUZ60_011716 [Juncus effusus]|nr:hypothetical protein LUZ60_011716 [Juncus effusus]